MSFDFNDGGFADSRSRDISKTGSAKGFQNKGSTPAKGFQNIPERKEPKGNQGAFQLSTSVGMGDTYLGRTERLHKRRPSPRREMMIPWRIILMIVGVLIIATMLWVCRDAISAFLSQVLSWVITIIVIIFLVKLFIFRR